MKSENGYVIYPDSVGRMNLDDAVEDARGSSIANGEARVEDCDTEQVIVRFSNGRRI